MKICFTSKNSLQHGEKWATICKAVAHFSLFSSECSPLKRIFTSKYFSVCPCKNNKSEKKRKKRKKVLGEKRTHDFADNTIARILAPQCHISNSIEYFIFLLLKSSTKKIAWSRRIKISFLQGKKYARKKVAPKGKIYARKKKLLQVRLELTTPA